jgi:hypothetical protein
MTGDVPQFNRALGTPGHEPVADQLPTIVEPNGLRLASPGDHLLQSSDDSLSEQRCINLDRRPATPREVSDQLGRFVWFVSCAN